MASGCLCISISLFVEGEQEEQGRVAGVPLRFPSRPGTIASAVLAPLAQPSIRKHHAVLIGVVSCVNLV